jgi:hypothetical protein
MTPPTPDGRLAALPSMAARRAVLGERIRACPRQAARELEVLVRAARSGRPTGRTGALAVASTLIHLHRGGEAGTLAALWEAAAREGLPALAALLDDAPAHRALPWLGRLREVCYPERGFLRFWPTKYNGMLHRAWEARLRFLGMDRLLHHPSPILVGHLLDQRWLPLDKVLVIASRRPTSRAIALELACRDHWLGRIEVREAMVQNPFTPAPIALALLPAVSARALRRLRDTGAPLGRAAEVVLGAG